MPGLRPRPLNLTDSELEELNELINKHTTPQQIALRARIILLAEKGRLLELLYTGNAGQGVTEVKPPEIGQAFQVF